MLEASEVRTLLEVVRHLDGERGQARRRDGVRDVVNHVEHEVVREAEGRHREDERLGEHHGHGEQQPEAATTELAADLGGVHVVGDEAHDRRQDGVEVDGRRRHEGRLASRQAAFGGQEHHHVAVREREGSGVEHAAHTEAKARPEGDLALLSQLEHFDPSRVPCCG